jgi:hypothetical protein
MIIEVIYFIKYLNFAYATDLESHLLFERYMRILGIISGSFYVLLTLMLVLAFILLRRTI